MQSMRSGGILGSAEDKGTMEVRNASRSFFLWDLLMGVSFSFLPCAL